jgi:hypothetical protein
MATEKAARSLQESVLTALAFTKEEGTQIAAQIEPKYFDEEYRPLAELLLNYRRQYHKPPGRSHLDELIDTAALKHDVMEDTLRIVAGMVTQIDEGFNAQWVVQQTSRFVRSQVIKATILESSQVFQDNPDSDEEIANMWVKALRYRHQAMEPGLFLNDPRGFAFLDRIENPLGVRLGIPFLDKRGIIPTPGQMLLYIAAKGTGKTWFCVHCGRRARQQQKRVCHITLEMDEGQVFERYVQNWLAAAKHAEKTPHTKLLRDKLKRLVNFKKDLIRPKLHFGEPSVKKKLLALQQKWGTRWGGLVIKRFPSGSLTVAQLVAYLDFMEEVHNFVPQVLIVDYPDLMKVDAGNYRHSLGQIYVDLRGIAQERNLALVTPTQGTRSTFHASRVRGSDVSEDKRKVDTADNVLTYSQTDAEKAWGLARLSVEYARYDKGGYEILLTQSYATGQYVLDSTLKTAKYEELRRKKMGPKAEEEDD